MQDPVRQHPALRRTGNPTFCFSFTSDAFDIHHVNHLPKRRGWRSNGERSASAIHLCVTGPQPQRGVVERFGADLAEAVASARLAGRDARAGRPPLARERPRVCPSRARPGGRRCRRRAPYPRGVSRVRPRVDRETLFRNGVQIFYHASRLVLISKETSMRIILSLVALCTFGLVANAQAASLPFTAELSLSVGTLDPVTFTGEGIGESTPGGGAIVPADAVELGIVTKLATPILGILTGFAVCGPDLAGQIFPVPTETGVFNPCDPQPSGFTEEVVYDGEGGAVGGLDGGAYLLAANNSALVSIPLSVVGVGGTQTFLLLGSPASLDGNPWTTGAVFAEGTTPAPHVQQDEGFDQRDPVTGEGALKLVTTSIATLGALGTTASLAALTITFAPEPAALGQGIAVVMALAALQLRARRRRA
jgi:hypothetical protein